MTRDFMMKMKYNIDKYDWNSDIFIFAAISSLVIVLFLTCIILPIFRLILSSSSIYTLHNTYTTLCLI